MGEYHSQVSVRYKSDMTPVTSADHAAEEIILEALAKLMPGVPVVAEEQTAAGILPETGDLFFLVDPLDGTKEFLKRNGEFTVNIALISKHKPCFGLIYAPAKAECYLTLEPSRAIRFSLPPEAASQPVSTLDFQPLNGESAPARALTSIVSRSSIRPETKAFLETFGAPQQMLMGSSLKFCVLARGDADVYPRFGPTSEWDTAAGHAILDAAGGCVMTASNKPLLYGKKHNHYENPAFIAWRRDPGADALPSSLA
jgi:3'(2'), 5'-bisphosphate nucleotidase